MRALPPLPSLCMALHWWPSGAFVGHPQQRGQAVCGRRRSILSFGAPPALELQGAEPALQVDAGLNGDVLNGENIDVKAVDRRPHEQVSSAFNSHDACEKSPPHPAITSSCPMSSECPDRARLVD